MADESNDHFVKPEGLLSYVVLPPSLCEPIDIQPVQSQLFAPKSGGKDDPDENEDSVEKPPSFVAPEEDEYIFDLLDQYYIWCSLKTHTFVSWILLILCFLFSLFCLIKYSCFK